MVDCNVWSIIKLKARKRLEVTEFVIKLIIVDKTYVTLTTITSVSCIRRLGS